MRVLNYRFLRIGDRVIIVNGKSPLRYFDLRALRLHTYKEEK